MPFAPHISKQILQALDEHIIPALQSQVVAQVLAEPPFDFHGLDCQVEREEPLPDKEHGSLQVIRHWKNERMLSLRAPILGFVYAGASSERIGVTAKVARQLAESGQPAPPGITAVRLPAPGIVCYPSYSPHSDGARPPSPTPSEPMRMLGINLMGDAALPFLIESGGDRSRSSHLLHVDDAVLVEMGKIYRDELRQADNARSAQAQLLVFMYRLRRYLAQNRVSISNSCWPNVEDVEERGPVTMADSSAGQLSHEVMAFVQLNLHLPLSLEMLADHFHISSVHLNRVFQRQQGSTVMNYVSRQRIAAGRQILAETGERIGDIATLVGFASADSFGKVFRRHTGLKPSQFRRNQQRPKPTA